MRGPQVIAERCRQYGAQAAEVVPLDVLDFKSHAAVASRVVAKMGRIDVLVRRLGDTVAASIVGDVVYVACRSIMRDDRSGPCWKTLLWRWIGTASH